MNDNVARNIACKWEMGNHKFSCSGLIWISVLERLFPVFVNPVINVSS